MKGPSTRRIVAVLIAAVLVLLGGAAFWIKAVAAGKFERLERDVQALHDEALRRDSSRSPRLGPLLPGSAWADYDQAISAVRADKGLSAVDSYIQGIHNAVPEKARERVAAHVATLDFLRSGARRTRGDPVIAWERAPNMPTPQIIPSITLGNLAAARARFLAEEGKPREAADLLLDACQFAHDLGTNSIGICSVASMLVYGAALEELRALIVSGALSKEDLRELSQGLQAADRPFPGDGFEPRNEALFTGFTLLNTVSAPNIGWFSGDPISRANCWRGGFSVQLTFALAFEEVRALCDRTSGCETLPWPQARSVLAAVDRDARASKNPLVPDLVPNFASLAQAARERRAQLRLLRAAAAWRATGEIPPLDDPLGTTLLHAEKDGVIRVWSVGRDGVNHGGVGSWKPESGKDLLLEWKR